MTFISEFKKIAWGDWCVIFNSEAIERERGLAAITLMEKRLILLSSTFSAQLLKILSAEKLVGQIGLSLIKSRGVLILPFTSSQSCCVSSFFNLIYPVLNSCLK